MALDEPSKLEVVGSNPTGRAIPVQTSVPCDELQLQRHGHEANVVVRILAIPDEAVLVQVADVGTQLLPDRG